MNTLDKSGELRILERYMGKHGQEKRKTLSKMAQAIRSRANYSLGVFGISFVDRGSGNFLNIRRIGRGKTQIVAPPKNAADLRTP